MTGMIAAVSRGSRCRARTVLSLRLKVCGRAPLVTSSSGSRFIEKMAANVQRTARNINGGLLQPYRVLIVYAYALFNEWNGVHVAQKIQTLFIDDIDGSEAEGTVRFALDGAEYEIDLNAKHAEALRKALARYVDAARRSSGGTARRPARSGRRAAASGLNTTEVREWAKAQGIEVKDRGRVPAELVVRFRAATGN
jgi:Lsr2